jgi:hypothetical protein
MKRRTFARLLGAALISGAGAGCLGQYDTTTKEDVVDALFTIREGESFGKEMGNDHWRITVLSINDDDTIDIRAEKIPKSELGGGVKQDPIYTFERTDIPPVSVEKIEERVRVAYFAREGDSVQLGVGDFVVVEDVRDAVN